MDTESNQSGDNSNQDLSLEDDRQRTGLFSWGGPDNLMPPWSVPPGLLVPGPRQPEPGASPPGLSSPPGPAVPAAPPTGDPAADDGSWPGVAPPAGWFLHAQERSPAARLGTRPVVPGATDGADADLERITSEPLAPGLPEPGTPEPEAEPEPKFPGPGFPEQNVPEPGLPDSRAGPPRAGPPRAGPPRAGPPRARMAQAGTRRDPRGSPGRFPAGRRFPLRSRPQSRLRPRIQRRSRICRLALAERRHRGGALPAP